MNTTMSALNFTLAQNIMFVRPEYFFISGFSGIPFIQYYFIFLFVVYIISVFGNSFVLIMILSQRSLHTPKYIGIFNLALADIGETNALIPNLMKTFFFDSQYISYEACLSNMFFVFFFTCVQSLTLVVLAYDRFVAICLPLRYHNLVNNSVMSALLAVVWFISFLLIGTMVLLITRLSFCKSNVVQSYFCDHGPVFTLACNDYSISFVVAKLCITVCLYAPIILIFLSYLGILLTLCSITTWAERLKALKTCVSHLLAVGVFFLPLVGTYISVLSLTLHPNARIVSTSLSNVIPPLLNPIIYVLSTKEFKYFMQKMLKRKSTIMVHV